MTLLLCWVVFPLALAALALGCGLLVEQLAGASLPGPLLLPLGLATVVVVAGLATLTDATAELAVPGVVGLSVAGLGLAAPRGLRRMDGAALAAAVTVFAIFAAPVALSGEATFAGYIKLDDTASWFALTDRALEHGRSLDGLAPSTYEATLDYYLAGGYPLGSLLPLGIGSRLVTQDVAWVFQPFLAFIAAMLALALYALTEPAIASRRLRAVAAVVAAQPALLFGYALWGGVKELAAAAALSLVIALVVRPGRTRVAVPLAVACAAALGILGLGGAVWLVPALAAVAMATWRTGAIGRAATFAVVGLGLSLPPLLGFADFIRSYGDVLTSGDELGNLFEPLSPLQTAGIWPSGDFRVDPDELGPTYVLMGLVLVSAASGLTWAWSRRHWGLVLFAATAVVGAFLQAAFGSPWVDAKAFAIASPAVLLLAMTACLTLLGHGRRVEAVLAAAGIAGGVVWSNALAYREVSLAPRDQLVELERIGERFAGQGPALMTEFQPYGVRHFLRTLDAEGASELRRRPVLLKDGGFLGKGAFADIDELQLESILAYRALVLRRSPVASRPPSVYTLAWQGRYYEVWQRRSSSILEHVALGGGLQPAASPSCREVRRLAGLGTVVAGLPRRPIVVTGISSAVTAGDLAVPLAGQYTVWVSGSFRRRLEFALDGEVVATIRHRLNNTAQWERLAAVRLAAGRHRVSLRAEADLLPGSGGPQLGFGPLVLTREEQPTEVLYLGAKDAQALCGRKLDWVEALAG